MPTKGRTSLVGPEDKSAQTKMIHFEMPASEMEAAIAGAEVLRIARPGEDGTNCR
jgi:hypothetical protein